MAGKITMAGSEVAQRYASAFFDLAQEEGRLDALESDLTAIGTAIEESDDLQALISSPVYSRAEKESAISAILSQADPLTRNLAALMAANGRLFALPGVIVAFRERAAQSRGEVSAEAISAVALNDEQQKRLRAEIEASIGKAVNLQTRVDEKLLGGLIVKVGSKMVDSSLRTKLTRLKMAMKEA
ncbi:F0F1 ATP synthase subunit delta [Aquisalinus flavus]|uniref:ATP synthase subunit delta n=1 Tax=Aquisalinus flavus TaxID=1526572 RepID=A0A8J2Y714_9PROT|nr:F0F1 ATP synthase subunit delta [Aquisalinus flavus]MBD0425282.1 F0F1 ATP synthase subunit delta [Aquisalinus flavus]UNE49065.1 F0F1 ATP synthase subunit delta [Aquisalinus flavus]GGD17274.1 ATP synthase subunit delta [Aquisalinus flavus]